jgi:DHA1 family inner membrane transport protein
MSLIHLDNSAIGPVDGRPAPTGYAALYMLLFLAGAEMYLVSPLLPALSEDFRVSVSAAASLVTAYVLTQAVFGPALGLAYGRFGARRLIVGGAATFAMGNLLAASTTEFPVLLAGRVLSGLGIAMAGPAIWTYIAHTARDSVRGTAIGFGMGSFALGQAAGVPAGAFIASAAGWRASFGVLAVATMIALPLSWMTLRETPCRNADSVRWRALIFAWTDRSVRLTLPSTFLFHAANLGAYTYLAEILHTRYGLATFQLGFIGVLSGVGTFFGSNLGGAVGDRLRRRGVTESWLLPFWSLSLLTTMVVALSGFSLPVALVGVLLWFVAAGAFDTNQQTLISTLATEFTSVALAWNLSILFSAAAFGVWIMGVADDRSANVLTSGLSLAALATIGSTIAARALSQTRRDDPASGSETASASDLDSVSRVLPPG